MSAWGVGASRGTPRVLDAGQDAQAACRACNVAATLLARWRRPTGPNAAIAEPVTGDPGTNREISRGGSSTAAMTSGTGIASSGLPSRRRQPISARSRSPAASVHENFATQWSPTKALARCQLGFDCSVCSASVIGRSARSGRTTANDSRSAAIRAVRSCGSRMPGTLGRCGCRPVRSGARPDSAQRVGASRPAGVSVGARPRRSVGTGRPSRAGRLGTPAGAGPRARRGTRARRRRRRARPGSGAGRCP